MPQADDKRFRRDGTRFRVYPQSPVLASVRRSETVWLSPSAGSVGPGPSDPRMRVVDPALPKPPYEFPELPPYRGLVHPPVEPGPGGHFDHLAEGTREFRAAHMYAVLRRVLDIWEGYHGGPIPWHFREYSEYLELVPWLEWDNAHSGFGFIETGIEISESGVFQHYAENFDVLAHELGHSILYSVVGTPTREQLTAEYLAFHESMSDVMALLAVLHFDSVVDRLLDGCRGNLYTLNELNRIAEQSESEEIRIASNDLRLSDVADAWSALPQSCDEHRLGQPLTGAVFDILVDVFLDGVERWGLVPTWLTEASRQAPDASVDFALVQREFDSAYERSPQAFKQALVDARDYLGRCLAVAWQQLDPVILGFGELYTAMLVADEALTGGQNRDALQECFEWREIAVRPIHGGERPAPGEAPIVEHVELARRIPYLERVLRPGRQRRRL